MMKFIVLALVFVGCVAAATNSSSSTGESSTGESSTGVSSSSSSSAHVFNTSSSTGEFSSSAHVFNTSSSTGELSSTGLSSSSSEHNATFSSSSSEHNSTSSSTGEASSTGAASSTGEASSSTGSIPTPIPSPCYWSTSYGNISETTGNFTDPASSNTLINNNTYIIMEGWITSISMVYHESSPSPVYLKRIVANVSNGITWYSSPDYVNVTGLINSTAVQTVNLTQPLAVKKGDFLGLFSATGTFGLNGLTDGYTWCTGNIQPDTPFCYVIKTEQLRIQFTLQVEVPCPSSSTGVTPNSSSSSSGRPSNSSSSSSTGAMPTFRPSSSSTGAAPTDKPTETPQPQEASNSKSVTAVGVVVGAASMLGAVLLVFGICWCMKRNQNTSNMNSPLLSNP